MEKDKKEKNFEESMQELATIVSKLEEGDVLLDDAIKEFQKAMELAKVCDEKLKTAEEAIHKIVDENGEIKDLEITE